MQLSDTEVAEAIRLGLKAYNDIASLSVIPDDFENYDENKARLREIALKLGMTKDQIRSA